MSDVIESTEPAASPAPSATSAVEVKRARTVFAGYTAAQLLLGLIILALAIWAIWVTRTLMIPREQHIVRADLSRIVGEYVTAQSRTLTPPERVQTEMKQFMSSLDAELGRRGAKGQVVLVGEAVLSKGVPDITDDVAKAVYASGVNRPKPASEAELRAAIQRQQMQAGQQPAPQQQLAPQMPAPAAAAPDMSGFGAPQGAPASAAPSNGPVGAAMQSFGGPDAGGY
ncbi:type-F conjugative transfer system protein TrbI [Sphingomonas sp. R1]|uniref:type-F conjugative transfer system protein TrbI n=1 Tax=Sphingomonas sp. R1 TaxID=399176 RepID=UPI002224D158|nr:type-F conjugative transfer system protein TrbI [Sphingomonas sp. R1]UYY79610.1 type-F conjugative transfer system protein TrbI [Sphingomonas sp. R1]